MGKKRHEPELTEGSAQDSEWGNLLRPLDESSHVDDALHIEVGSRVYRALTGLDYEDKRVEAGDLVSDIPEDSVEWLLRDGHIQKVED